MSPPPDLPALRLLAARPPSAALARELAPAVLALCLEVERLRRHGRSTLPPETEDGRLVVLACERLGLTRVALAARLGLGRGGGSMLTRAAKAGGQGLPERVREMLREMLRGMVEGGGEADSQK